MKRRTSAHQDKRKRAVAQLISKFERDPKSDLKGCMLRTAESWLRKVCMLPRSTGCLALQTMACYADCPPLQALDVRLAQKKLVPAPLPRAEQERRHGRSHAEQALQAPLHAGQCGQHGARQVAADLGRARQLRRQRARRQVRACARPLPL